MDIAYALWGVLGGVMFVTVLYAVIEAWRARQKPIARPITDAELMSRVDELSAAVEKLLKVYRSQQMKRVRAGAADDAPDAVASSAAPGDRKAALRAQLFKIRGNN